jgi:hypothetical protein
MANMHKHKQRMLRGVDDETWAELGAAADLSRADRSAIIRELIAWYLRRPSAKLPERPPARRSGPE